MNKEKSPHWVMWLLSVFWRRQKVSCTPRNMCFWRWRGGGFSSTVLRWCYIPHPKGRFVGSRRRCLKLPIKRRLRTAIPSSSGGKCGVTTLPVRTVERDKRTGSALISLGWISVQRSIWSFDLHCIV